MKNVEKLQIRDAFICGVIEIAEKDKDVIIISNDFGAPALDDFRENYPSQFINAGISEQNIISVAAAMACEGKKVFVYSIASFVSLRCFEQLKLDVCVHHAPVTIMAGGVGLSYAEDGPTHHALEDISVIRSLAGIDICSPTDALQAYDLAKKCVNHHNPMYVRLDKGSMPLLKNTLAFEHDGFRASNKETKLLLISTGFMVHRCVEIAKGLNILGIKSNVIDLYQVKPLSIDFVNLLSSVDKVVTVEEHTVTGGLGTIIAEELVEQSSAPKLKRFAISEDKLYVYGVREKLHKDLGLDVESIVSVIKSWYE